MVLHDHRDELVKGVKNSLWASWVALSTFTRFQKTQRIWKALAELRLTVPRGCGSEDQNLELGAVKQPRVTKQEDSRLMKTFF